MIIGHFQEDEGRFTGIIQTLLFSTEAVFISVDRPEKGSPDYLITTGDTDLGVAWRESGADGESYLVVKLDDPTLPQPIVCRLVQTGPRGHVLLRDRTEPS
jgi:uncharacterized protein (DUF736 family)